MRCFYCTVYMSVIEVEPGNKAMHLICVCECVCV